MTPETLGTAGPIGLNIRDAVNNSAAKEKDTKETKQNITSDSTHN